MNEGTKFDVTLDKIIEGLNPLLEDIRAAENKRQSVFETNEAQRQTNENKRQDNEENRVAEFEKNEAERQSIFEQNEKQRHETTKALQHGLELKQSLNLYNPSKIVSGEYIHIDGSIKEQASYKHTGYIDVTEGDVLTFFFYKNTVAPFQTTRITAYDADGNAVSDKGVGDKVTSYVVPAGIVQVIISLSVISYNIDTNIMILKNYDGTPPEPIEYFDSYYVATKEFVEAVCYSKEEIDIVISGTEKSLHDVDSIKEAMMLATSLNLCNPEAIKQGYIETNGILKTNSTYRYSDYIDVTEGDILTFFYTTSSGKAEKLEITRVCAYDAEGNAVSDSGVKDTFSYTVPAGIVRVIVSFGINYFNYGNPMIFKNYDGIPEKAIEYFIPRYVATKDFISGICYTEDEVDAMFKELENGNITEDYIFNEIDRVKSETLANDGVLNFIFQTDQHIDGRNTDIHQIHELVKVADIGQFDFICMGGDLTQLGDTSWYAETDSNGVVTLDNGFVDKKPMVLNQFSEISKILNKSACPAFYCIGNHDVGFGAYHGARNRNAYYGYTESSPEYIAPDSQSILPKEIFRIFNNKLGESVVWDSDNPKGCYFYKDFERSKIRVVVMNTQDVFNDDGSVVDTINDTSLNPRIQQKQFSWFCNKALNFMDKGEDRSKWAVLVLSHANVFLGGASGGSIGNEQSVLMRGVLNAFMTGGKYTGTTSDDFTFPLSADVDFTEQGAVDFICSINGHVHADTELNIGYTIDNFTGYDEPYIDRPCIQVSASSGGVPQKDYSGSALKDFFKVPDREEGTITYDAFDIFSIDRANRKIKTIRFGAGEDRVIDY